MCKLGSGTLLSHRLVVKGTSPMINRLRKLRFKRRNELISPLRDKEVNTLRYPGQSIQYMLDDEVETLTLYIMAVMVLAVSAMQTWNLYRNPESLQFQAWVMTVIAIVVSVVLMPSSILKYRNMKRLRDARNGERIVAEHLNQLIADDYTVFHDVPCGFKKGKKMLFNIDHLLVGKKGIFAVETKTMRKVQGKQDKLEFDGQHILRFGKPLKYDPIEQATSQAKWLTRELVETTGKHYDITPVVTFPGWYIVRKTPPKQLLVLSTPTADVLRSILAKREERLSDDDVVLVKHRIKMQIQDHRP
jgi:hypothetical protein